MTTFDSQAACFCVLLGFFAGLLAAWLLRPRQQQQPAHEASSGAAYDADLREESAALDAHEATSKPLYQREIEEMLRDKG